MQVQKKYWFQSYTTFTQMLGLSKNFNSETWIQKYLVSKKIVSAVVYIHGKNTTKMLHIHFKIMLFKQGLNNFIIL